MEVKSIEIELLNRILSNMGRGNKELSFVDKILGHQGIPSGYEGMQGEYNEYHEIYSIRSLPELFIKVTYNTNSYGDSERITSTKFVKKVKKEVNIYD